MSLSAVRPATNDGRARRSLFCFNLLEFVVPAAIRHRSTSNIRRISRKRGRPAGVPTLLVEDCCCNIAPQRILYWYIVWDEMRLLCGGMRLRQ